MDVLTKIVNCLKPKEKRYLKRLYLTQPNGEDPKKSALFNLILKNNNIDDQKACKSIYGSPPNSAFSHTKRRLKEDLLNFLLTQDSSKQFKSKQKQEWLKCNKLILQGEILVTRGILSEGEKLLKNALKIAEENELLSEIIRVRIILRESFGVKFGMEYYERYSDGVINTMDEYKTKSIVLDFLYNLRLPNTYRTNNTDYNFDFESVIDVIRSRIKLSNKEVTRFYYLLAETSYSEQKDDFFSALRSAKELEKHVENTKIYKNSNNDIAGVSMTIANVLINLNMFIDAQKYALKAVNTFVPGKGNQLRAMEFLFFAYLRGGDFENASKVAYEALRHPQIKRKKITLGKWELFETAVFFLQSDFDSALKSLRSNNGIQQDKKGWGIGFRILEILISLENGDHYIAGYHLDNYFNYLNRIKDGNISRAKIIGQLFRSIVKFNGDMDEVVSRNAKKIELLSEGLDEYKWNPIGYELVRFDAWLKSKLDSEDL